MTDDSSGSGNPPRAMRLIFEYDGEDVHLVSQQPVNMAVADYDPARLQHPGYYIDSRNATGQLLARVQAHEAFASSVEVFPERRGEPISRLDVAQPRGAFTVVVPLPADADRVTVVRVARPDIRSRTDEVVTTDLATFPLQINR